MQEHSSPQDVLWLVTPSPCSYFHGLPASLQSTWLFGSKLGSVLFALGSLWGSLCLGFSPCYRIPRYWARVGKKHLWLAPRALEAERTGFNPGSATSLFATTDKLLMLFEPQLLHLWMGMMIPTHGVVVRIRVIVCNFPTMCPVHSMCSANSGRYYKLS